MVMMGAVICLKHTWPTSFKATFPAPYMHSRRSDQRDRGHENDVGDVDDGDNDDVDDDDGEGEY